MPRTVVEEAEPDDQHQADDAGDDPGPQLFTTERRGDVADLGDLEGQRRAPYLSVLASSLADFWVKAGDLGLPAGNRARTREAEIEVPSSTIANWFCGGCLAESAVVAVSNSRAPSGLNSRFTCQAMPFCGFRQRRWPADCLRSAWGQAGTFGPGLVAGEQGLIRNVVRLLVAGELYNVAWCRLRSAPIPSP